MSSERPLKERGSSGTLGAVASLTPHQRARYRLRYAIRQGKIAPAEQCAKCDSTDRITGYFDDPERELDVVWLCRRCYETLIGKRQVSPVRRSGLEGEIVRKLPPYDVLRAHLVDEGLSYQQVADRYKVGKSVTFRTVKQRALRRNDWPLPIRDESRERMRRGLSRAKPTTFSRALCDDILAVSREFDMSVAEIATFCGVRSQYLQEAVRERARMAQKQYDKVSRGLVRLREHYDAIDYHMRVGLMRNWLRELLVQRIPHRSIRDVCVVVHVKDGPLLRKFVAGQKTTIPLSTLERLERSRLLFGSRTAPSRPLPAPRRPSVAAKAS